MTEFNSEQSIGWIKLHRKIMDSRVFANPEILKLWLLCLCRANHAPAWVDLDGITDSVEVQPGQFITGRYALHREFYPISIESNRSPSTLWRWLKKLAKWGNLNIKSYNKYSVIEIVNWHLYQIKVKDDQGNEHEMNIKRTTDEQQMNTEKNDKNDKNVNNEKNRVLLAEKIYQAYPRKVGKKKAIQAIVKAMIEVDIDELLSKVNMFSKSVAGQDAKYIPHPATWFNQGRWEDDTDDWTAWKRNDEEDQDLTPQYFKRLG